MSWVDVTKGHLERESAEVREAGWGGLVAKPKDEQGFTAFIIARRLQYSLDRRVEVVGVRDVKIGDLSREQMQRALKSMLEGASEVELKGLVRRVARLKEWGELRRLRGIFGELRRDESLLKFLVDDERVLNEIREAAPEMLEIFPRLFPSHSLEMCLLLSGRESELSRLVSQYANSPDGLSWILRAHVIYGVPRLGESIRRNYALTRDLSERLEELTLSLLSR